MKQKVTILLTALLLCLTLAAQERSRRPHMSKEEFDAKREQFITRHAGLTDKEAAAFFPIYNECQRKKHELNGQIWKLRKETRGKQLSEEEYHSLLEKIANLRIQVEELEKEYLPRYHTILTYKQIFAVQGAEGRFQRELLKNMKPAHDEHQAREKRN